MLTRSVFLSLALLSACTEAEPTPTVATPSSVAETVAAAATEPPAGPGLAGAWSGTFTPAGSRPVRAVGLVTADGEARFVTGQDVQEVGRLSVEGDRVVGTLSAVTRRGVVDVVEVTAVLSPGERLVGTFRTREGGSGELRLDYDAASDVSASLGHLAGIWRSGRRKTLEIGEDGSYEGRNGRCEYSGRLVVVDPTKNAYRVESATLRGCGRYDGELTGLAMITSVRGHGEELVFGISNESTMDHGFFVRGDAAPADGHAAGGTSRSRAAQRILARLERR